MIHPRVESLLHRFSKIELFDTHRAVLIGGTALAYHLGHRESLDLDIAFPFCPKLPSLQFLESFEEVMKIEFDPFTIQSAIDDGGDIDEVTQRYLIEDIKVDFLVNPASNIYKKEILQNEKFTKIGTLRIASIESLFRLKSLLLLDRNRVRDLYDVVYMLKFCGFSGKDIIDTITRYRITYRPKEIVALVEAKKEDPLDYEGIRNPTMDIVDYDTLKEEILFHLRAYI